MMNGNYTNILIKIQIVDDKQKTNKKQVKVSMIPHIYVKHSLM